MSSSDRLPRADQAVVPERKLVEYHRRPPAAGTWQRVYFRGRMADAGRAGVVVRGPRRRSTEARNGLPEETEVR